MATVHDSHYVAQLQGVLKHLAPECEDNISKLPQDVKERLVALKSDMNSGISIDTLQFENKNVFNGLWFFFIYWLSTVNHIYENLKKLKFRTSWKTH